MQRWVFSIELLWGGNLIFFIERLLSFDFLKNFEVFFFTNSCKKVINFKEQKMLITFFIWKVHPINCTIFLMYNILYCSSPFNFTILFYCTRFLLYKIFIVQYFSLHKFLLKKILTYLYKFFSWSSELNHRRLVQV